MVDLLKRIFRRLHMSLGQYLTAYVVIGFLICIFGLWAFYSVAEDVVESDAIVHFDQALATELHSRTTTQTVQFWRFMSLFGSQIVIVVTTIVALYYAYRRRWLHLLMWLVAVIGGQILNVLLKEVFARPRPVFANPWATEITASFPSGHAMISMIFYGMLAYFLVIAVENVRTRIVIVFVATLMVVLIGISRMYLGVHYFSDVLAGFAAGGVWLGICLSATELIRQWRQPAPKIDVPIAETSSEASPGV
jgi:membrane-associated phospholipid phosphatase